MDTDTELDTVDLFIDAPLAAVAAFLMDIRNASKFAFGREQPATMEFLTPRKVRVSHDPLVKTSTVCDVRYLMREDVALIEHSVTMSAGDEVSWNIFMLLREWGTQTHALFGWFNTPEIKRFMCKMHGWKDFDASFIKNQVAREELKLIKQLVEAASRNPAT